MRAYGGITLIGLYNRLVFTRTYPYAFAHAYAILDLPSLPHRAFPSPIQAIFTVHSSVQCCIFVKHLFVFNRRVCIGRWQRCRSRFLARGRVGVSDFRAGLGQGRRDGPWHNGQILFLRVLWRVVPNSAPPRHRGL